MRATEWQAKPTTKAVAGAQGCFGVTERNQADHIPGPGFM